MVSLIPGLKWDGRKSEERGWRKQKTAHLSQPHHLAKVLAFLRGSKFWAEIGVAVCLCVCVVGKVQLLSCTSSTILFYLHVLSPLLSQPAPWCPGIDPLAGPLHKSTYQLSRSLAPPATPHSFIPPPDTDCTQQALYWETQSLRGCGGQVLSSPQQGL